MANYRKSFNFRSGLQVDNDNFLVTPSGLVGIGTTNPQNYLLNVYGDTRVTGLVTTGTLSVGGTSIFYDLVNIGSGITMDPTSGIISAIFYGDGSNLSGLPAGEWTISEGVQYSEDKPVGILTNSNTNYSLQIGGDPANSEIGVGIINGNVIISGITTSNGGFIGSLTGTASTAIKLENARDFSITGDLVSNTISFNGTGNVSFASTLSDSFSANTSGIITASSFYGPLTGTATTATNLSNAANITTGTISDARLPNIITSDIDSSGLSTFTTLKVGTGITMFGGIITATTFDGSFTGDLTGVASTANKLENSRDFSVSGDILSQTISFDGTANVALGVTLSGSFSANTSGIITANTFSGIITSTSGTFNEIRIDNDTDSSLVITSDQSSIISIGASVGAGNSSVEIKYTSGSGRLDINNYDLGGVSINLHEGSGAGSTEGFSVKYDNIKKFEVTYDGKVGINRGGVSLTRNLEITGDTYVNGSSEIVGVLTVGVGANKVTLGDGSALPISNEQNFNTDSGISTFKNFNVSNLLGVGGTVTTTFDSYTGRKVGVGTTNDAGFVLGNQTPIFQIFGSGYATEGFMTNGILGITTDPNGSTQEDPRIIPNNLGGVVPSMTYGTFQVDCTAASLVTENILLVPNFGVPVAGFGSTNLGLVPSNYNTNKYLTKVGVNTYFARSLFDVGAASTTMNSYFILPSLPQTDLNIVADLWNSSTSSALTGHEQSRKVTPNGLVPGGIVHNQTTDTIQVRSGASSFRNISPVVAFATVDGGSLVSTDGYNLALSNSSNDANWSFSTALQSANYTVMVSNSGTTTYSIPEVDKTTTGFKIIFTSSASARSYSVMVLQI